MFEVKVTLAFVSLSLLSQQLCSARLQHHETKRISESEIVGKDNFCAAPVAKGKVNFPESLIGRAKAEDMDMYSGYVNISSAPDYLFYWYFSSRDGNSSAPLIIWTNGGPGCSAMEGATTEVGPLRLLDIKESCQADDGAKCDYNSQFSPNTYAWNANAHMLFVDQPKNVGMSFGYGSPSHSSKEAADEFIVFLQNWLVLFPEFKGREIIIAGESYGGHYIPAWSNAILDFNENNKEEVPINLVGVIIGNGCINSTFEDTASFVEFQHQEGLIPDTSNPRTQAAAYAAMISHLGYEPNYYDYRTESISCTACYGYNYTAWSYWFLQQEVLEALHVCGDAGVDAFAGSAGGCISMPGFDADDSFDYSGALARTLDMGIPVTLYYGKQDTACNYVGGLNVANNLSWKKGKEFQSAELTPIKVFGVEIGQMKQVEGLTFIQVEGASHMVPNSMSGNPAAAAFAISTLLERLQ